MAEAAVARCPKCGEPRDEARAACAKCGLSNDRMAAFQRARDASIPDALTAAWTRTQAQWTDPTAHDEVLRLVTQHDAYAWAAGQYREAAQTRPADPVAQQQLDRVRRAAEVTLLTTATTRQSAAQTPYRATIAVLGLLVIAAIAALIYAMARRGAASDDPPPPPPPPQSSTN
ncbi:MAG: hypothetical protein H0X17_24395 [Deltaproteobacteria bacterium]|nr:hypothetical protein [Deltaproteobacteria bacterium]